MFSGLDVVPLPSQSLGSWSYSGRRITAEKAVGLPAMLRGIRFLAEAIAGLPLIVYRGDPTNPGLKAEVVETSPQYGMLHLEPNTLQTPFDFKAYIVASMIGHGGAYMLKSKVRKRPGGMQLVGMYPLNPSRVKPEMNKAGDELIFKVRVKPNDAQTVEMTREDLIYIPGFLFKEPYIGTSPVLTTANAVGAALAAEEFAARFYDNDATPAGVIEFPDGANTQKAKDTREVWEDRHRSAKNAHRVGVLFGGAKYTQVGVDASRAQIIDAQRWNVEVVANILGLPVWTLGGPDPNPRSTPEQRNTELLQFGLVPWLVRIEQALAKDDDLFPDKGLVPHFVAEGLLRAEMMARYEAYLKGRQAGWLSVNDIRRKENEPPIEGGDIYQATPVGGAPNLQPGEAGTEQPEAAPDDAEQPDVTIT